MRFLRQRIRLRFLKKNSCVVDIREIMFVKMHPAPHTWGFSLTSNSTPSGLSFNPKYWCVGSLQIFSPEANQQISTNLWNTFSSRHAITSHTRRQILSYFLLLARGIRKDRFQISPAVFVTVAIDHVTTASTSIWWCAVHTCNHHETGHTWDSLSFLRSH